MNKKSRVTLTADERSELAGLLARGKADVRRLKHAQILLKADEAEGGLGWSDERIAEAVGSGRITVARIRRALCRGGPGRGAEPLPWRQAGL